MIKTFIELYVVFFGFILFFGTRFMQLNKTYKQFGWLQFKMWHGNGTHIVMQCMHRDKNTYLLLLLLLIFLFGIGELENKVINFSVMTWYQSINKYYHT